jgi:hypothetical protein
LPDAKHLFPLPPDRRDNFPGDLQLEVKYDGLYEGHAVKKFFAISISSLPTFQEGSFERSSALMAR